MADTYPNWASLAAANVPGTDYRLDLVDRVSPVVHIAIHGGSLEDTTSEIADAAATAAAQSYYSMVSLKPTADSTLHITSDHYDEPSGVALARSCCYCVSYHGKAGAGTTTFMGGRDLALSNAIGTALAEAGFTVSFATADELNGSDLGNITNRTRKRAGVQLEIERGQRDALAASAPLLAAYAAAIASVTAPLEG